MNNKIKAFWILTAVALLICLAVVITAFLVSQTDDGSILSQKPLESEDYEIMWSNSSNWQKKGDIYYYIFPIEPQEVTENLIDTCIQKSDNPDSDRKLVVDIYSQVIQAEPAAAVQEAWSVGVGENGKLLIDNTP